MRRHESAAAAAPAAPPQLYYPPHQHMVVSGEKSGRSGRWWGAGRSPSLAGPGPPAPPHGPPPARQLSDPGDGGYLLNEYRHKYGTLTGGALSRSMRYADPWVYGGSVRAAPQPRHPTCCCPDAAAGGHLSRRGLPAVCKKCGGARPIFPPHAGTTAARAPRARPQLVVTPDPYDLVRRNRLGDALLSSPQAPHQLSPAAAASPASSRRHRARAKSSSPSRRARSSRSPSPNINLRLAQPSSDKRKSILECDVTAYELIAKYLKGGPDRRRMAQSLSLSAAGSVEDLLVDDDDLSDRLSDNALDDDSPAAAGARFAGNRNANHNRNLNLNLSRNKTDINSNRPGRSAAAGGVTIAGQRIRLFNGSSPAYSPRSSQERHDGEFVSDEDADEDDANRGDFRFSNLTFGRSSPPPPPPQQQQQQQQQAQYHLFHHGRQQPQQQQLQVPQRGSLQTARSQEQASLIPRPRRPPRRQKSAPEPHQPARQESAAVTSDSDVTDSELLAAAAVAAGVTTGAGSLPSPSAIKSILKKPASLDRATMSRSASTSGARSPAPHSRPQHRHHGPHQLQHSQSTVAGGDFYLPTFQEFKQQQHHHQQQHRRKKQVQFVCVTPEEDHTVPEVVSVVVKDEDADEDETERTAADDDEDEDPPVTSPSTSGDEGEESAAVSSSSTASAGGQSGGSASGSTAGGDGDGDGDSATASVTASVSSSGSAGEPPPPPPPPQAAAAAARQQLRLQLARGVSEANVFREAQQLSLAGAAPSVCLRRSQSDRQVAAPGSGAAPFTDTMRLRQRQRHAAAARPDPRGLWSRPPPPPQLSPSQSRQRLLSPGRQRPRDPPPPPPPLQQLQPPPVAPGRQRGRVRAPPLGQLRRQLQLPARPPSISLSMSTDDLSYAAAGPRSPSPLSELCLDVPQDPRSLQVPGYGRPNSWTTSAEGGRAAYRQLKEHRNSDPGPGPRAALAAAAAAASAAASAAATSTSSSEEEERLPATPTTPPAPLATEQMFEDDGEKPLFLHRPDPDDSTADDCVVPSVDENGKAGRTVVTVTAPPSPSVHRLQVRSESVCDLGSRQGELSPRAGRRTSIVIGGGGGGGGSSGYLSPGSLDCEMRRAASEYDLARNAANRTSVLIRDAAGGSRRQLQPPEANRVTISVGGGDPPSPRHFDGFGFLTASASCTVIDTASSNANIIYNNMNNTSSLTILSQNSASASSLANPVVIAVSHDEGDARRKPPPERRRHGHGHGHGHHHRHQQPQHHLSTVTVNDDSPHYDTPADSLPGRVTVLEAGAYDSGAETGSVSSIVIDTATPSVSTVDDGQELDEETAAALRDPVEAVRRNLVPHVCGKRDDPVDRLSSLIDGGGGGQVKHPPSDEVEEHYPVDAAGNDAARALLLDGADSNKKTSGGRREDGVEKGTVDAEEQDQEEDLYESIKDHIYEEIGAPTATPSPTGTATTTPATTATSSAATTPSAAAPAVIVQDEHGVPQPPDAHGQGRSMFEGASKYDILSYLADARDRVHTDEDADADGDADADVEELAAGGAARRARQGAALDLSSRASQLSNASDSSEDSVSADTPAKVRKSCAEIERNDSGVGSETSKSSRSRWQSGGAGGGGGAAAGDQDQLQCEDCDQRVDTHVTDSGVMFAPMVCRKCAKRRAERKELLAEIVDTEEKYARDLKIALDEFYRPMLVAGLLTPDQLAAIFLNMQELLEHSRALAHKLRDSLDVALEQGDEDLLTVNIGRLFLEAAPMLHAFESYCTRQGAASMLLSNLEKEKEILRIFLRVSQMENAVLRRMNLNSFLMVPVQRVTKYPLLLARLYKLTPAHHEGRELLKQAQHKIELHLEHINSEAKDISTMKLWRRISIINGRRSSSESDMINIKLRKMALEVLEWNHEETTFSMEGKLLYTNPTDNNWRKGRTIKLNPINALLVTKGKLSEEYQIEPPDDLLMFPRKTGVREATLLLVREKSGRYSLLRDPLYLDKCIVCCETDWEDYFEVQELASKETYIFKGEDGERTKTWYRTLQCHAQGLGSWRRRRNALANIINGMVARD